MRLCNRLTGYAGSDISQSRMSKTSNRARTLGFGRQNVVEAPIDDATACDGEAWDRFCTDHHLASSSASSAHLRTAAYLESALLLRDNSHDIIPLCPTCPMSASVIKSRCICHHELWGLNLT